MKRIAYFNEKINSYEWQYLTVDKMIQASGFNSRNTGYRAFIKHLGVTPSKYLIANKITQPKISRTKSYICNK